MRRAVTLIIIFFASFVVTLVLTPTGDPYTCCLIQAVVLCFGISCYFVGLRHGRTPAGKPDNGGMQDTANVG